jgi:excisionase family DNA binding protein
MERKTPQRLAYSPAEAAEMLSISRATFYKLIEDGTVRSLKLGRRRLVRHEALVELLDRLEAGELVLSEIEGE